VVVKSSDIRWDFRAVARQHQLTGMQRAEMNHLDLPTFLGLLIAMLGAAKLFGGLAKWIGQPAVLGELCAGVILGGSVLGIVDPKVEVIHLLSELGVIILLLRLALKRILRSY
jgi:Kef-type K+ transport system membrane component KefB